MHAPARALARLLRAVSRRLGRSGGTTAPGNQWTRTWSPRGFSPMKVNSVGIHSALLKYCFSPGFSTS